MAADEAKVDRIISDTLNRHGGAASQDPDVKAAAAELYQKRNAEVALVGDENYAIAEHYMVARSYVARCLVPLDQMLLMIVTYNTLKMVAQKSPMLELLMRHDPRKPMAPPSALDLRKSKQGAWDGEAQRLLNGRPRPDFNKQAGDAYNAFGKNQK